MYVLHGTWVPTETQQLENWGEFALWIETPKTLPLKKGKKRVSLSTSEHSDRDFF
jgi:hypothetical protein